MTRRIDIRFSPVDDLRYVTDVIMTDAAGEQVLFDIRHPRPYGLHIASATVERMLKTGTWSISFPEVPGRAPMVYDAGVAWKRLVAFRTDVTIEQVGA